MKYLLATVFLFCFGISFSQTNCRGLRHCTLTFEADTSQSTVLSLKGRRALYIHDEVYFHEIHYRVKWIDDCTFQLTVSKLVECIDCAIEEGDIELYRINKIVGNKVSVTKSIGEYHASFVFLKKD